MPDEKAIPPTIQVPARSEEVNDIIERMPESIGNKVTYFILFIFFALVSFSFIVKYPDVVTGELVLNSSVGPVKIVSNTDGKMLITRGLKPKQVINSGTYIGYIQNAAKLSDVQLIDSLLRRINLSRITANKLGSYFPANLSLGEINEKYFSFYRSFIAYQNHYDLNLYGEQIKILKKQAKSQQQIINTAENDALLVKNAYALIIKGYERDSILHSKKVLTIADLEKSRMELLTAQRTFQSLQSQATSSQYQLEDVINKLQQVGIQKIDAQVEAEMRLTTSYYALLEGIKQWQLKYAFIAPMDGILEFSNFWNQNDYISYGQELFTVIPSKTDIYGQVFLPEKGAGKVRVGQSVIVKLNDFPYNEYGSVAGKVRDISMMTNQKVSTANQKENLYLVKVDLPIGLRTNYGTTLDFRFGAKGVAEIVTADKKLINRFFDNLKYQISK